SSTSRSEHVERWLDSYSTSRAFPSSTFEYPNRNGPRSKTVKTPFGRKWTESSCPSHSPSIATLQGNLVSRAQLLSRQHGWTRSPISTGTTPASFGRYSSSSRAMLREVRRDIHLPFFPTRYTIEKCVMDIQIKIS
ncbi:hypothetical protein PMAYCL1PPCAC_14995, partial [Pristionchus mayeri]